MLILISFTLFGENKLYSLANDKVEIKRLEITKVMFNFLNSVALLVELDRLNYITNIFYSILEG